MGLFDPHYWQIWSLNVNNKKQEKDAVTFGALKAGSAEFFVRGTWGYIARKHPEKMPQKESSASGNLQVRLWWNYSHPFHLDREIR